MNAPRVTFGLVSFNRLHYLKATLESARECIVYPDMEWVVVDGGSVERGLQEYLRSQEWLDHLTVRSCTHADAMNEIVARATGEYVLIWPEDVQFVCRGDWMTDLVEILGGNHCIGSVGLDFLRKSTIRAWLQPPLWTHRWDLLRELRRYGPGFRRHRVFESSRGFRLFTTGWVMPGVVGSGIPSLTRTEVWRNLGGWRAVKGDRSSIEDSSLGAEDDMVQRFYSSGLPLQMGILETPVAADIITDPAGCKAKVRKGKRYGRYVPPPEGGFYYRISDMSRQSRDGDRWPVSFMEGVQPLGFEIPTDEDGERRKAPFSDTVSSALE